MEPVDCQEAPSTHNREKKPDEEAAVEPVREEVRRGVSSGTSGLSGAPSTYDREKKPDEEAAVEPVDCQDVVAVSSEARRQPR